MHVNNNRICRENIYTVSPKVRVYTLQMEDNKNGKVQKTWKKLKPEKGFNQKPGNSFNRKW